MVMLLILIFPDSVAAWDPKSTVGGISASLSGSVDAPFNVRVVASDKFRLVISPDPTALTVRAFVAVTSAAKSMSAIRTGVPVIVPVTVPVVAAKTVFKSVTF